MSSAGIPTVPTDLSPKTTLAIILGASEFPKTTLSHPPSFANSARDFRDYLTREDGLGIPADNILPLFDTDFSPDKIQEEIAEWLGRRRAALEQQGTKPRDLIFYYVGHGSFSNPDQQYILAIRATRKNYEGVSSVKIIDLGATLGEAAIDLRRYLILDCCFAAAAVISLMAPVNDVVQRKTLEAFPPSGTTLLCASDAHDSAEAPPDLTRTIFSGTMLSILDEGDRTLETGFSMNALGSLVRNRIREKYKNYSGLPEVHTPVQNEGNIAAIPLFPNAANRPRHLKDQIEAVASQLSQTRAALESFTDRLMALENATTARLTAMENTLTSRVASIENDVQSIAELRSRMETLENRPVKEEHDVRQIKSPWEREQAILEQAPPDVVADVYHYRRALLAGRIWASATLVLVSLSIYCLAKGYSFFGLQYRYDPIHWVPVVVFAITSAIAFLYLRARRYQPSAPSPTAAYYGPALVAWQNLPSVIAAKNARYVKLFSGLRVVSPYFELAWILYLIQLVIFALHVVSGFGLKTLR